MIPICRGKAGLNPAKWIYGCLVFDPDDAKPVGIIQQSENAHPLDIPYMCDGCVACSNDSFCPDFAGIESCEKCAKKERCPCYGCVDDCNWRWRGEGMLL